MGNVRKEQHTTGKKAPAYRGLSGQNAGTDCFALGLWGGALPSTLHNTYRSSKNWDPNPATLATELPEFNHYWCNIRLYSQHLKSFRINERILSNINFST